jgi:hypothetical protein
MVVHRIANSLVSAYRTFSEISRYRERSLLSALIIPPTRLHTIVVLVPTTVIIAPVRKRKMIARIGSNWNGKEVRMKASGRSALKNFKRRGNWNTASKLRVV